MKYLIHKRGGSLRDQVLCSRPTEREARELVNRFESIDVEEEVFEPETYYIEEVRE